MVSYNIENIGDKSANIVWQTTNKTTSEINYTNTSNGISEAISNDEKTITHIMKLEKLSPGIRYSFKIKGIDEYDQVIESDNLEFTTLIDTKAPVIEYIQTEMALISKGEQTKIQAVITWNTDEESTSEIIYIEGAGISIPLEGKVVDTSETSKTEVIVVGERKFKIVKGNGGRVKKHILVITEFKPGTVYTFKAKSVDEAGNVSYSKDYSVLTPNKKKSVIQIIMNTFEETFGWLKM